MFKFNFKKEGIELIIRTTNYRVQENEIGIAVSHYHSKLGPMFLAIQFDFSLFDRITQYNILQDSISSRSNDLSLFASTKEKVQYTIRIKKVKIKDPIARGGVKRYALLLIIPSAIKKLEIDIDDILQILLANKDNLDWEYLNYRLNWINLKMEFIELLNSITLDHDDNLCSKIKEI